MGLSKIAVAWRVYAIPAGVFQSLMIGGGYGTGREIVEYFSRFGVAGGLLGFAIVGLGFALLLVVSFEFARQFRAYDYRLFFRELLGRGWPFFEIVYLTMFTLVLAVIAAAAGTVVQEDLHLPSSVGVGALLLLVTLFAYYGRTWVTRILAYKALLLSLVLVWYFLEVASHSSNRLASELSRLEIQPGWQLAAARYLLYSTVTIPTMLFATRAIETRRQAILSGILCAAFGVIPGVLLHVSFAAGYPEILTRPIPLYWMITALNVPVLTAAYLVVLLGSLFDVGLGFIQSVNERVESWSLERRNQTLSRATRAGIASLAMLISGALSLVGIVKLISQGYGTIAFGFLILFVIPLMTVGLYRLAYRSSHRTLFTRDGGPS